MVRNVADVYQSEQYSMAAQKVKRAQGALNILSNSVRTGGTDSVHISDTAHKFSKQSIAALIDKSANTSAQELSFYFSNYNNMEAILYAINFGENVSCGYNPDFKEYGVISFDYHGNRQVVPNYAVPKINSALLSDICAKNNSLVLSNQSYYSWTSSNGGRYAWTVNNGRIGWAASESLLAENTNQKGTNYKWEMRKASNILTALAQGKSLYGYDKKDVLDRPKQVIVSDMTTFKFGIYYFEVTFYFDVFTKEILSYRVAERRGSRDQYIDGLAEVVELLSGQKEPTVIHTDQGSVYASIAYNELIKDTNIIRSMSRAGKPTDNPVNESLNGWMKEELFMDFKIDECRSREEFRETMERYVHFYNNKRPCYAIGYDTPVNYRKRYYKGELGQKNTFENRVLTEEPKFIQKRRKQARSEAMSTFGKKDA